MYFEINRFSYNDKVTRKLLWTGSVGAGGLISCDISGYEIFEFLFSDNKLARGIKEYSNDQSKYIVIASCSSLAYNGSSYNDLIGITEIKSGVFTGASDGSTYWSTGTFKVKNDIACINGRISITPSLQPNIAYYIGRFNPAPQSGVITFHCYLGYIFCNCEIHEDGSLYLLVTDSASTSGAWFDINIDYVVK